MKALYASLIVYFVSILSLFLYSYTQVDLSLTLSKISAWQTIEKGFQYIGYFNRPLSTYFYIAIIMLMGVSYLGLLHSTLTKMLSRKQVWALILFTAAFLTFSYNAFSYDLFNYIFDAKIFTHYHLNPYAYKPLDFPYDPMLSFMHWTHRTYPYGPLWLVLTVPLSFLGMNIFLPTFFLFKMLMSASFVGTSYFLEKILQKRGMDGKNVLFGLVFFACNPLVIVESLVSAHIDVVMLFFLIASLYFILRKGYIYSIGFYLFSVGIKFATIFTLPVFALLFHQKTQKLTERKIIMMIVLMTGAVIAQSVRTNFQPWYLLDVLPLAALLSRKYYIFLPVLIISFLALFQYVWFLFTGNFDPPYPSVSFWITVASLGVSMFAVTAYRLGHKQ